MPTLTARQREVLRLAALDFKDDAIAGMLEITRSGVRQHWNAIFRKLGCKTKAGAVGREKDMSFCASSASATKRATVTT